MSPGTVSHIGTPTEIPQSSPVCNTPKDTLGHRLGLCTHLSIHKQVCTRLGDTVHALASEIKDGVLGDCAMLTDAESYDRYSSFPPALLPLE